MSQFINALNDLRNKLINEDNVFYEDVKNKG